MWDKGYFYSHKKLYTKALPVISNIEATNACGMKCIMCPRRYMKRKIGFIDIKLFEKIIRQLKANSRICLHHFGDPLLHPKIGELIRICNKYGIKTSLATNPTSLTKEKIKEILDAGLYYLHISLDGANKETYEKIRGGVANYELALKQIQDFLDEKNKRKSSLPVTTIAIINMKETEKDIKEFKEKWGKKRGIDKVEVKEFISWDGSMPEITNLAREQSHKVKRKEYYPCIWPWAKVTVLWDGRVAACCFDYDGKCILGDLKKQRLEEIWNSKRMKQFREQNIKNSFPKGHLCQNCKEREGFPPSKIFPINLFLKKRLNFLKYYKFN